MAIYMNWQNNKIKGAVTTEGFKDWIEVTSLQWGVGRGISMGSRTDQNRESSEPSISEVTISKRMDISSVELFQQAVAGELNNTVKLYFTTTTQGTIKDFLNIELTNTAISGYSMTSGGDMPSESISLNFTKVLVTYKGLDPATTANPKSATYDLTKMKSS